MRVRDTARTLRQGFAVVVVAFVASGCTAIHEAVTGRHLECLEAEAVCIRITDLAYERLGAKISTFGIDTENPFTLMDEDCRRRGIATAKRCWMVFLNDEAGESRTSMTVVERADGSIATWVD